jgi:flagellar basal body-associated protein FliL
MKIIIFILIFALVFALFWVITSMMDKKEDEIYKNELNKRHNNLPGISDKEI